MPVHVIAPFNSNLHYYSFYESVELQVKEIISFFLQSAFFKLLILCYIIIGNHYMVLIH